VTDLGQLFEDLVRVETRLYNAVDTRLQAAHSVSLPQYELMQIIGGRTTCRVNDIAHEVNITVGAASKAVDRLVAAGWCRRRNNPTDGRSSLLSLTPAGSRICAKATPTFEAALSEWIDGVVPQRSLDQLGRTLRNLRLRLEADDAGGFRV
jgi:DNA-binding MarR family transcriptional regulator